jgi:hypothetical protein
VLSVAKNKNITTEHTENIENSKFRILAFSTALIYKLNSGFCKKNSLPGRHVGLPLQGRKLVYPVKNLFPIKGCHTE